MNRKVIALTIGLGLACLSIALGMLYLDFTAREGAWMEMRMKNGQSLTPAEQAKILEAWQPQRNVRYALLAGSLGVALLGGGGVLGAFEIWGARGRCRCRPDPSGPGHPASPTTPGAEPTRT